MRTPGQSGRGRRVRGYPPSVSARGLPADTTPARAAPGDVEVFQVDERDSSWEDDHPRFRVYLHGGAGDVPGAWTDTYDVIGADLLQVVDWAQHQAGDRLTYAVALVGADGGGRRGLVWLVGMDANEGTDPGSRLEGIQQRMLLRRRHPVRLGTADAMPADVPQPDAQD